MRASARFPFVNFRFCILKNVFLIQGCPHVSFPAKKGDRVTRGKYSRPHVMTRE